MKIRCWSKRLILRKKILRDDYNPTKEEDEFLKQKADKNNTKTVGGMAD
ncbi:hypothetical protein CVT06_00695 [Campylobacter concisus]|uniref:Uncharacterized protein n=1 Tax=Campylobacter concisus TaxID=199 RepID=A0A7S9R6G7_9BACT|nr:hypothetical protein [Campylobacter concisus]QPH83697.1 hypothetical protein CVT06_00695 [Campylobacter concisus]